MIVFIHQRRQRDCMINPRLQMIFVGDPVTEEPKPNASSLLHSPHFGNLLSRVLKALTK